MEAQGKRLDERPEHGSRCLPITHLPFRQSRII